jgi:hypothetical protein
MPSDVNGGRIPIRTLLSLIKSSLAVFIGITDCVVVANDFAHRELPDFAGSLDSLVAWIGVLPRP